MTLATTLAMTLLLAALAGCSTSADTPLLLASDLDFPLAEGRYAYYQASRQADCKPIDERPILRPDPASNHDEIFCPTATTVLTRTATGYTLRNEQEEGDRATMDFALSNRLGDAQILEIDANDGMLYAAGGPVWIGNGSLSLTPRAGLVEVWGASNLDCKAWGEGHQMEVTQDGSCKLASRDMLVAEIARTKAAGLDFTHQRLDGPLVVLVPIE